MDISGYLWGGCQGCHGSTPLRLRSGNSSPTRDGRMDQDYDHMSLESPRYWGVSNTPASYKPKFLSSLWVITHISIPSFEPGYGSTVIDFEAEMPLANQGWEDRPRL